MEYREDPNVSAWVMAHAGSGKTYALVRRVVALLLEGADPRTIWCVTYTNIAAAEMRGRIGKQLETFAALKDDDALKSALEKYLEYEVSDAHVARLREVIIKMRRSDVQPRCTTMHGLCQYILRIFAFELGLSPSMQALDEEARRMMLSAACKQVLSKAMAPDNPARRALLHMLAVVGSYESLEELLRAMIMRSGSWGENVDGFKDFDDLMQLYLSHQGLTQPENANAIIQRAHAQTPAEMREVAEILQHGSNPDKEKGAVIQNWLNADEADIDACWEAYLDVFVTKSDRREARSKLSTKILVAESAIGRKFQAEQQRIVRVRDEIAAQACAYDSACMRMLYEAVNAAYQEMKAQADCLDFDDMIFYVKRLFSNPQTMGYAMSKLDWRLEHLLIDEAQDTSPDQWDVLSALVEDLCTVSSHASSGNKTVFVVGDTKQSIYSFQGAAPWMMQKIHKNFEQIFSNNGRPFITAKLSVVHRSVPEVLALVDRVGAQDFVREGWMEEPQPHVAKRSKEHGEIICWPPVEHDEKIEREAYYIAQDYALTSRANVKLAEHIANEIASLLGKPHALAANGKTVTAGDIMILVRRRGRFVPAILRALEARHIPVAGADRVRLSEHVFTRDVLALISWCFQEEDDLSLARVLRSPIGGLSEDDLFAIAHARTGTLWDALFASDRYITLCQELCSYRQAKTQSAYGLLVMILQQYGHLASYRARLGDNVVEILDEILEYAAGLEGKPESGLLEFLARMKNIQAEIKRSGNSKQVVRVLTVHGAKGLEAPIVFVADMADVPNTAKEKIYSIHTAGGVMPLIALSDEAKLAPAYLQAKENRSEALFQEYTREMYVAITRARDVLYLCTTKNNKNLSERSWYHVVSQALEQMPDAKSDEETGVIRCKKGEVLHEVSAEAAAQKAGAPTLPDWLMPDVSTVALASDSDSFMLTPSRLGADEHESTSAKTSSLNASAEDSYIENPRCYGTAMHAVLAWATPDTPEQAIKQALQAEGLGEHDTSLAIATISNLWAQPEIATLLEARHVSEQGITGSIQLHGRTYRAYGIADRLVFLPDACVILDFKTALTPPQPDAMPISYLAQLGLYHALLSSQKYTLPLRAALLWTQAARIDWLSEEAMQQALLRVTKNLADSDGGLLDDDMLAA